MAVAAADEPLRPADIDVRGSTAARTRAINLLEQAGAVLTTPDGRLEYLDPSAPAAAAVARAVDAADTNQRLIRSRIEMMRGYADTIGCRRQFLLGYFGEQLPEPCGNCDTCEAGTAQALHADAAYPPNSLVEHPEWGRGLVMTADDERITVLFDEVGYKTLSRHLVDAESLLKRV
jgi:ATP-dependent DNA helicase RecQ